MNTGPLLPFVAGLALLVIGGELLVKGASRLARRLGMTPLVIGLTVVAFGTSAPELATSLAAALRGQADVAFGNVVGSNIFNVLFILGISALIAPLVVEQKLVRVDVPVLIAVSFGVAGMAWDLRIARAEGAALLLGLSGYVLYSLRSAKVEEAAVTEEYEREYGGGTRGGVLAPLGAVVAGLAVLVLGARWLVAGAVAAARALEVSDLIIGLTIVAAGTSLPEVVTSIVAAIRNERDIAVGNVVGSNLFNLLGVLGAASFVPSEGIAVSPVAMRFDVPVMIAASVACLPIFVKGYRIARWEGAVLLGYYVAYTAFLILDATDHDALPAFSGFMLIFVAPLTVVTLAVALVRHFRSPGRPTEGPGRAGGD